MAKNAFQSKTIWGVVAMVGGLLLQTFGVNVDLTAAADGVTLSEILVIAGAIISALGARFATQPVTLFGKTFGGDLAANPAAKLAAQDDVAPIV